MLAPDKHTPTYPASSAPDTRSRRALPKPCNVGPDAAAPPPRPRRHPAHPSARHPRPPDPGPRTPPPQQRRVPARHRTVPRPRAWDARASIVSGATAARPCASKPSRRNDQRPRSRPPRPRAAPSPRRARPQSAAEPHPPPSLLSSRLPPSGRCPRATSAAKISRREEKAFRVLWKPSRRSRSPRLLESSLFEKTSCGGKNFQGGQGAKYTTAGSERGQRHRWHCAPLLPPPSGAGAAAAPPRQ